MMCSRILCVSVFLRCSKNRKNTVAEVSASDTPPLNRHLELIWSSNCLEVPLGLNILELEN
jgi:hypothetical protein